MQKLTLSTLFFICTTTVACSDSSPVLEPRPQDNDLRSGSDPSQDAGTLACRQITSACHDLDTGASAMISACHHLGHEEQSEPCKQQLEHCLAACDPNKQPFALPFVAVAGADSVSCTDPASGLGDRDDIDLGISDLRFYVSDLRFFDDAGQEIPVMLEENPFQHREDAGQVTLIDLTSNREGTCTDNAIALAEGTARTHTAITGLVDAARVKSLRFDVGVPQALMQSVIANNTAEGAPSPLDEMYWSWATGYRHFVLNATLRQGDQQGDAYVHLGSRDCGSEDGLALEGRDRCGFVNTPKVALDVDDLQGTAITVDVARIAEGLDFIAPVYDPITFEVIGEQLGVSCHSEPSSDDCPPIFGAFGLDIETGAADAEGNAVFGILP